MEQDKENVMNFCPEVSLQDSFKKFLDQKKKEKKIQRQCRLNATKEGKRSEDFTSELRQNFIETCKKYLGVPYAERFKKEDDPVAPLYLDCCGLVRQAVKDLQEEFGFVIGRWNQAYQFDTLPIVLEESQLKPGDLIFYEGIYNSNRSKPQKHNMVHVEVFLGGETGEATIGSRYHRGVVSIFPSFKFKSTTWDLVQYHFRSLDPWLQGECVSHCCDHQWTSDLLAIDAAAGKRSIFYSAEEEDVSAGGEEEDESGEEGGGDEEASQGPQQLRQPQQQQIDHLLKQEQLQANPIESVQSASQESDVKSVFEEISEESKKPKQEVSQSSASLLSDPTKCAEPLRKQNSRRISEKQSQKTMRTSVSGSLDSLVRPKSDNTLTYYVGKSNGWQLVKAALDKRGWQQLPFDYQFTAKYGLKWVERRGQIDYKAHTPGQLVCHIPNNEIICSKVGLLTTLRGIPPRKCEWLPDTFLLSEESDIVEAIKVDEICAAKSPMGCIWIYKPPCNNRGRGIQVFRGKQTLLEICNGIDTGNPDTSVQPRRGIIQRYIEDPLLLGPSGFKFDIRCYLLIARNFPSCVAFYHPGYCRLTLKPYVCTPDSFDDPSIHLTNAAIQKKDALYKENWASQIQSMSAVAEMLEASGNIASATYFRNNLNHDIKRCFMDVLKASVPKLQRKHGYFDLLGCDFMVTSSNRLQLLEINTNPAMSLDNAVLEELLPRVIDGALQLVLELQGPSRPTPSESNSSLARDAKAIESPPSEFQLLMNEATGFLYA